MAILGHELRAICKLSHIQMTLILLVNICAMQFLTLHGLPSNESMADSFCSCYSDCYSNPMATRGCRSSDLPADIEGFCVLYCDFVFNTTYPSNSSCTDYLQITRPFFESVTQQGD
ncbi:unnamed protein product [Cuscuta epithymum]|uniref:Uncharacterized protein n=1 Tax=Cuscuta epithymum TaxID=186058 RepID=A0AAV0DJ57_9ASTE|nr:unnamed protein product [Cuscuta epithymum]